MVTLHTKGHKRVYDSAKIIHRDIFPDNLLLGKHGAEVGNLGVVIDFDMAVKDERTKGQVCTEKRSVSPLKR